MDSFFLNIDCLDGMKRYPDNFFDLAIVDLQQGNGHAERVAKKSGELNGSIPVRKGNYMAVSWDNSRMGETYFQELFRVSKNQIIFCAIYYTDLLPLSRGWIVWNKFTGKNNFSDCELAWSSFDRPVFKIDYMWNGMQQGKSIREGHIQKGNKKKNEVRIHPTQKPVKLYQALLREFAKPGDKILDTHVGSASSLIACHLEGFKYGGFEKDGDHFRDAIARMDREIFNTLFY